MIFYATETEFNQAAINCVARLVSDKASKVIATGNVADIGEECLGYLEEVAVEHQLSPVTVTAYLEIIRSENELISRFFGE